MVRKSPLSIKKYFSSTARAACRKSVWPIIVLLILLAGFGVLQRAVSQTFDRDTKFRLAQGLEQAGEYDRASEIYQELLRTDPTNTIIFEALERTLMQLKKYDEVIRLLQSRLAGSPTDFNLLVRLGSVLYRAGRNDEATAEWERALAQDPHNPNSYRILASVLMENRLIEQSIDAYRRGRVEIGDPGLFSLELAQLYAASMDYTGAAVEYVRWLRANPTQLAFVQNRMAFITGKEQGRAAAITVVQQQLNNHQELPLLQLLGWLEMEGKDFEAALHTYHTIDEFTSAHGNELLQFADRAYSEKAYAIAAHAYQDAIEAPIPAARMAYARYGYATALKELRIDEDTIASPVRETPAAEAQPLYRGPIALYEKITQDFPHSEFSAKAYYQMGLLQFEKLSDRQGAITSFRHVLEEVQSVPALRYDAELKIGQIYLALGDSIQAGQYFQSVVSGLNALPDQHDEAAFHLAEIAYFGGRFDEALNLLAPLSMNVKADYANDALRLQAFVTENKNSAPEGLKDFSHAEFLSRQKKNTEAIAAFQGLLERYPMASFADDALLSVASLEASAGLFDEAIGSYEKLLGQFKETGIALDRAQFQLAEVYQYGVHDAAHAIATYEKLLAEYPRSVLASQARKRVRQLRGETP